MAASDRGALSDPRNYERKGKGKNKTRVYNPTYQVRKDNEEKDKEIRGLESDLKKAKEESGDSGSLYSGPFGSKLQQIEEAGEELYEERREEPMPGKIGSYKVKGKGVGTKDVRQALKSIGGKKLASKMFNKQGMFKGGQLPKLKSPKLKGIKATKKELLKMPKGIKKSRAKAVRAVKSMKPKQINSSLKTARKLLKKIKRK